MSSLCFLRATIVFQENWKYFIFSSMIMDILYLYPAHNTTTIWIAGHQVNALLWPGNSLHPNTIENLWNRVKMMFNLCPNRVHSCYQIYWTVHHSWTVLKKGFFNTITYTSNHWCQRSIDENSKTNIHFMINIFILLIKFTCLNILIWFVFNNQ